MQRGMSAYRCWRSCTGRTIKFRDEDPRHKQNMSLLLRYSRGKENRPRPCENELIAYERKKAGMSRRAEEKHYEDTNDNPCL